MKSLLNLLQTSADAVRAGTEVIQGLQEVTSGAQEVTQIVQEEVKEGAPIPQGTPLLVGAAEAVTEVGRRASTRAIPPAKKVVSGLFRVNAALRPFRKG